MDVPTNPEKLVSLEVIGYFLHFDYHGAKRGANPRSLTPTSSMKGGGRVSDSMFGLSPGKQPEKISSSFNTWTRGRRMPVGQLCPLEANPI